MPLYPALDKLAYQEPMLLDERWVMSYAAGLKDYNKNACKEVFVDDIKDKLFTYYQEGYPMGETSHIKGLDENFRWRKGHRANKSI